MVYTTLLYTNTRVCTGPSSRAVIRQHREPRGPQEVPEGEKWAQDKRKITGLVGAGLYQMATDFH